MAMAWNILIMTTDFKHITSSVLMLVWYVLVSPKLYKVVETQHDLYIHPFCGSL